MVRRDPHNRIAAYNIMVVSGQPETCRIENLLREQAAVERGADAFRKCWGEQEGWEWDQEQPRILSLHRLPFNIFHNEITDPFYYAIKAVLIQHSSW